MININKKEKEELEKYEVSTMFDILYPSCKECDKKLGVMEAVGSEEWDMYQHINMFCNEMCWKKFNKEGRLL